MKEPFNHKRHYLVENKEVKWLTKGIVHSRLAGRQRTIPKPLKSTPIKSNGVYNAREIIKAPNVFALVTIRYADLVRETISIKKSLNPTILAVSLRACSFAKSIASLTKSKIDLIDHFGPNFTFILHILY